MKLLSILLSILFWFLSITLAWYWYDWKLAVIVFLAVGSVTMSVERLRERVNNAL